MSDTPEENQRLSIVSNFVRERNVLFAMADFGALYVDYYLHLKDHRVEISAENDQFLKTALAIFALHCVSRPRNEVLAWTINFQEPLLNLFLGGDTETGDVVGRLYTENIKKADENVLYQELARKNRPLHRSVVAFDGANVIAAAEEYYARSEQRPARFFQLDSEAFAIVAAHPDYDESWFRGLHSQDVQALHEKEDVHALETRHLRWHCGCNQKRILKAILPVWIQDPEGLFLNEEMIEVNCPRCAAKYRISRELMEAYSRDQGV